VIVKTALAAATVQGRPALLDSAHSTDANLPMSLGIPAITMSGGGVSGGYHSEKAGMVVANQRPHRAAKCAADHPRAGRRARRQRAAGALVLLPRWISSKPVLTMRSADSSPFRRSSKACADSAPMRAPSTLTVDSGGLV
jgi:hypothetical protein